jgi:hypothetical protein
VNFVDVRRVLVATALLIVLAACSGTHPQTKHHAASHASIPFTTTSTTASSTALSTPPGVFYLQPSGQPNTLTAYDWTGKRLYSIQTAVAVGCCGGFTQSPDGSRIFAGGNSILDGQGHLLETTPAPGTWAEDNRHWCAMTHKDPSQPFGSDGILVVGGDFIQRIGEVGGYGPHGGPSVGSCSLATNKAVVINTSMGNVETVYLVNLSTHQVTTAWPTGPSDPCQIPNVVSSDGSTVANGGGSVCSLLTHQVVGHFEGQALALSRTGRLVVTTVRSSPPSPNTAALQVVDWKLNKVLWNVPALAQIGPWVDAFDEPGGDGLVLTITTNTFLGTGAADAWLIRPGATAIHLASNVTQGVE